MRVLVTGGTGFIGANVGRHLLARGHEVRCVVRNRVEALEGLDVERIQVPIQDTTEGVDALARAMDGCEGVYHVAGLFDPSPGGIGRMRQVHIYGTRALLRAMEKAGARRMVLCSSSITVGFGSRESPGDGSTPMDPTAIYGRGNALRAYHDTKLQSEALALGWPGLEAVVVNPDYILGAWDSKPTSGQLIVAMARRWVPVFPQGGKCFQGAEDCAAGHVRAMEVGTPGRRYLLGNENLSYREFMGLVAEVTGQRPPVVPVPDAAVAVVGRVGARLQRVDPHRFAGLEPWVLRSMQQERYRTAQRSFDELAVPRTPVVEAIETAYRWFREHGLC
jgi:dihydroflavonol-4-reductase